VVLTSFFSFQKPVINSEERRGREGEAKDKKRGFDPFPAFCPLVPLWLHLCSSKGKKGKKKEKEEREERSAGVSRTQAYL